ncbi:MAG: hypothetical protein NVS2B16_26320 [Chloroflexota bacterium]
MVGEYIVPPRLADTRGQHMQGDVFKDVPFLHAGPRGTHTLALQWGLLLTPTCDFALKDDHVERQLVPIQPGDYARHYQEGAASPVPLHLFLLPPLAGDLPTGAVINFRRAQEVHAQELERATRVATLGEINLRRLLAAHTTYFTRAAIDPSNLPIAPDDPRVLWRAIDDVHTISSAVERRTALEKALAIAIRGIARHHGIAAPTEAGALVWLEELSRQKILPVRTRKVVRELGKAQKLLLGLYRITPRELSQKEEEYRLILNQLEGAGSVLQERAPKQVTPQDLRTRGLANLLRS